MDCPEEEAADSDYSYDDQYQYLNDPNAGQEPEEPADAIVVSSNDSNTPQIEASKVENNDTDAFYDYGDFPNFENCNTLEECLGLDEKNETGSQLGADLVDYYYNSGEKLRPEDSVVSRPVFTADGQALLSTAATAVNTASHNQLDSLITSLTSLVQLLNGTKKQGNAEPTKNNYFKIPPGFGSGQMGNVPLPAIADDSLNQENFEEEDYQDLVKPLSHVGGLEDGRPQAHFKVRAPLPPPPASTSAPPGTTIPPFLIPIGPDGQPLLNPDGTPTKNFQDSNIPSGQHVSEMFPFLDPAIIGKFYETTTPPPDNDTYVDNRDFITKAVNMMRELPMDTRRRMLSGMVFSVPMAAATMAAVGVPSMLIAPLATVIPGFLFTAFMETDPAAVAATRENNPPRRRGLAGLVDAVAEFRRTHGDGHGHGHHGAQDAGHGHGHGAHDNARNQGHNHDHGAHDHRHAETDKPRDQGQNHGHNHGHLHGLGRKR